MPITEISAALNSFKTIKNILKTLMDHKAFANHKELLIELQGAVISAQTDTLNFQSQNAVLIAKKGDLEKEIARLKAWDTERQRYEMKKVAPQVFAYVIKKSMQGGEPVHWLCCNCYNNREKSVLQLSHKSVGGKVYECHKCGKEIYISSPIVKSTKIDPKGWT